MSNLVPESYFVKVIPGNKEIKTFKYKKINRMRKIYAILAAILSTAMVFAQTPEKLSYQAVIRNSSNALVANTQVGMQISILQGSESGTPVYVETHVTSTNANGLVSLEIGKGTVLSGDFTTIDWTNGPYFIKTETDPTGGVNYSMTGTSQLLSVPYALHAKTAETITGSITETDPIFGASPANGITGTNIANWNTAFGWGNHTGLYRPVSWVPAWTDVTSKPTFATVATSGDYNDLINKPTTDGSEAKVTAGTNVTVTGEGTIANPYVINASGATTLSIGQNYQGGIIFWLDATGQHGLIAATTDQGTAIEWYNGPYTVTNAVRDGIGAGMYNTERIIANQGAGSYAAQLCANYQNGGYGDWYLPSKYELNLLYAQQSAVGGFSISSNYWASTEDSDRNAWAQGFGTGFQFGYDKSFFYNVRAVRSF